MLHVHLQERGVQRNRNSACQPEVTAVTSADIPLTIKQVLGSSQYSLYIPRRRTFLNIRCTRKSRAIHKQPHLESTPRRFPEESSKLSSWTAFWRNWFVSEKNCKPSDFFDHMRVCKGVSDLAQEVNVEDFLIIMSYFQPMDTRVVEEQGTTLEDYQNVIEKLLSRNHHIEKYSTHSNVEEAMMYQPESPDEPECACGRQSLIRCWRGSQLTTP
ncbi:Tescalcin [Bos mutus]|uniref:Tescalcin n=1 Tax=Bos mutus TaxID=72004 RepID=L8IEP4_9CETA|nr:Tescalcin [Bos mutus]